MKYTVIRLAPHEFFVKIPNGRIFGRVRREHFIPKHGWVASYAGEKIGIYVTKREAIQVVVAREEEQQRKNRESEIAVMANSKYKSKVPEPALPVNLTRDDAGYPLVYLVWVLIDTPTGPATQLRAICTSEELAEKYRRGALQGGLVTHAVIEPRQCDHLCADSMLCGRRL
jgi:hypothetical protein